MKNLSTVNQFVEKHPWLTKGGIRSYIFLQDTNGLAASGAIIRIGRKILIEEDKFFKWIETQNQEKQYV
jgi:hypothetical protein